MREHGVDKTTIEQIRTDDRADFNFNRRFYHWTSGFGEYTLHFQKMRRIFAK